jgi:muconate cycloisomerase
MPIMVDESVWTPQDVVKVAEAGAADFVNIKITKTSGLKKAIQVYNTAEAHGLPCVIGTELESCMGLAAKLHIAAALEKLPFACEFTELAFQKMALKTPFKLDGSGALLVPSEAGLGVDPDLDLIRKYEITN